MLRNADLPTRIAIQQWHIEQFIAMEMTLCSCQIRALLEAVCGGGSDRTLPVALASHTSILARFG